MSQSASANEGRIDYIEFPATEMEATKKFYSELFGWTFEDYGPDYISFVDGRINGGFYRSEEPPATRPLTVIYSADLEGTEARVKTAGGQREIPLRGGWHGPRDYPGTLSLAGRPDAQRAMPVPVRITRCGLPGASSSIPTAAERAPGRVGLKLTRMRQ